MRALRFSYTFPTGFVAPYRTATGLFNYPLLYGFSVTQHATPAEIAAFTVQNCTDLSNVITFTNSNGKFLNILVPFVIGPPSSFEFNNFPVTFVTVNNQLDTNNNPIPAFAIINGVDYAYNFYVSEYPQFGTPIVLTMNP